MDHPHARAATEVASELGTSPERGLAQVQVAALRARVGPNQLREAPPEPLWRRFAAQFKDVVIWILMGAAVISGVLGEWADTAAILAIVLLNGLLGFIQEERAERALAALRKLAAPMAKVVRDDKLQSIDARELVPGDVIEIEAGDHVPADARLLRSFELATLEAALTGESLPVAKHAEAVLPEASALGDRINMVYLGTVAATGKATAVVVATGMQTELGRVAGMMAAIRPEPTPLSRRLASLGRMLLVVCGVIAVVLFVLMAWRGERWVEALLVAVSLAVAAVPEGLPAVVTIALALGLARMVRRNVIVRRLPSVETLGSVTVICTDKTGTLTRNELTVRELHADDRTLALTVGAECSEEVGDPTETALVVAARAAGIEPRHDIVYEIPFDSRRKAKSVAVRAGKGAILYTKGAPEVILARSVAERRGGRNQPLSAERSAELLAKSAEMASRALRVLALAYRELSDASTVAEERELVFVGLVGLLDPPRAEVPSAVERCRRAGIRPVLITGDHPATALAIAREVGIDEADVRARVSPEDKLRIVEEFKARGQIVAMTGDGVNDAPALKTADVGIAMGQVGTDVAREAADLVLTDDNFASIVSAVEEGRGIFDNIQKVVHFLLACNTGEVLFMVVVALWGWPVPLMPIQILWINLVTDGLPALALSMEPTEPDVMERPPRRPRAPIVSGRDGLLLLVYGALVAAAATVGFALVYDGHPAFLPRARTLAFCVVTFSQLMLSVAFRSQKRTLPELGALGNLHLLGAIAISTLLQLSVVVLPFARPIFETAAQLRGDWWLVIGLSLAPVTVVELGKLVRRAWVGPRQRQRAEIRAT